MALVMAGAIKTAAGALRRVRGHESVIDQPAAHAGAPIKGRCELDGWKLAEIGENWEKFSRESAPITGLPSRRYAYTTLRGRAGTIRRDDRHF